MKRYRLIGIIALALSLALLVFIIYFSSSETQIQESTKQINDNTILIGSKQGNYSHSTACQTEDGAVLIASILSPEAGKPDEVSIIKLSSDGNFVWEQTFTLGKKSKLDILKRNKEIQALRTHQISSYQNHYYMVLTSQEQQSEAPFILRIDQDGALLESKKVDLKLESGTSLQSYINKDKLYLSFIDSREKMLSLSKIDLLTAEVLQTSIRFIRQKNLVINAVAADPADAIISVVAYDNEFGCSFFQYTPQTDLKEVFRTQVATDIAALKYYENKLYGAVKEDSLLEVVDLTDLGKPLIKVTDILTAKDFRLIDLLIADGKFHVLAKTRYDKEDGAEGILAELLSYNFDGSLAGKKSLPGSDSDLEKQIISIKDKPVFILGESSGYADSKVSRLFIKKLE